MPRLVYFSSAPALATLLAGLAVLTGFPGPALGAPANGGDVPPPLELPAVLGLDEALDILRARGLDLLIAEASVHNAEGDVKVAGAVPQISLNAGIGKSFGYTAPPGCDTCSDISWSVGISDNSALFDTVLGKRHRRIAVAEGALEAARLSRTDALRQLEFQVKQQYFQAVQARAVHDFSEEVAKAMHGTLDLISVRFKAGAVSEADVAKAETAALEADQDVETAVEALRVAKVALAFLLGARGPIPDFRVKEELIKFSVPGPLASANREELIKEAREHRADLKAQDAQISRAEKSVSQSKGLRAPDISLSIGANGEGSGAIAIQPPTLAFGVTVTPPLTYQFQGEIIKAEADLYTQRLQRAKLEGQMISDVETAFQTYVSTRKRLERLEARLLQSARRARDLVQVQYEKGAASLLELLDANRTFIANNQEYFRELTNYWTAVFDLERSVGMELRK